jgi:superfamily II DNA/RNA helicase
LLPEWKGIDLHSTLKKSLKALGYASPTDIQKRSLGPALEGRDIVGVAETVGSYYHDVLV